MTDKPSVEKVRLAKRDLTSVLPIRSETHQTQSGPQSTGPGSARHPQRASPGYWLGGFCLASLGVGSAMV